MENTEALDRMSLSAPVPGTKEATSLMKNSSDSWPSHFGLWFTTKNWQMGRVSNLFEKLQDNSISDPSSSNV